jgi:glutamate N-acetyltransferase / amino-acid N-acetyltransferase
VKDIMMDNNFKLPKSFLASGVKAGIKKSGLLDTALFFSAKPAIATGTFTSNTFAAAPVQYCKNKLKQDAKCQAIIVNSGNANACTGEKGYKNAEKMVEETSKCLNLDMNNVLVASTGVIGEQLPMDKIIAGINLAASDLSEFSGDKAAEAIMTTDTVPKKASSTFKINNVPVKISAMAKGAGMIAPNMKPHATLLVFVMTDVDIEVTVLKKLFNLSIQNSFNRITIDGDMSTNDSAFIIANGASECKTIDNADSSNAIIFSEALNNLLVHLAKETVKDGEGVTKFVTVEVKNARNEEEAQKCAKTISESMLCKTAWFGCDANWGRIIMSIGMSGITFEPEKVDVFYEDIPVVLNGQEANSDKIEIDEILKRPEFNLTVDLKAGNKDYHIWTNDISYKYVEINAEYHT